jgi:hypothetical protein
MGKTIATMMGGWGGLWKSKRGQLTILMIAAATVLLIYGKIDQDTWAMMTGAQGGLFTVGNSWEKAAAAKNGDGMKE